MKIDKPWLIVLYRSSFFVSGKLFTSQFLLNRHLNSTHFSDPVTCDLCQKSLKTKKILAEHLKTHIISDSGK